MLSLPLWQARLRQWFSRPTQTRKQRWLWFVGLYGASVVAAISVVSGLRLFLPH